MAEDKREQRPRPAPPREREEGGIRKMLVKEYVERESRRITRTQAIARWLEKKWGHDRKCPYCNEREWTVDTEPVLFPRLGKGGDQGIPAYLVRCENCGNEVPLSAEVLGLWPDEM